MPRAAGAERSLRRLGRGEGLPALPQRGKRDSLEGVWAGALILEVGRGPAQRTLLLGRPSNDRSEGEERTVLTAACSNGKQISASVLFPQETMEAACSKNLRLG